MLMEDLEAQKLGLVSGLNDVNNRLAEAKITGEPRAALLRSKRWYDRRLLEVNAEIKSRNKAVREAQFGTHVNTRTLITRARDVLARLKDETELDEDEVAVLEDLDAYLTRK